MGTEDIMREIHIENRRLEKRLDRDLERYDMAYLYAPSGWGKYTFLRDYQKRAKGYRVHWLEPCGEEDVENLLSEGTEKRLIVIPGLDRLRRQGKQEIINKLLEGRRRDDRFLFSSACQVPEEMLVYVANRRMIVYGDAELQSSRDEVGEYFRRREIFLDEETLIKIEKDLHNIPIYMYMLENPLRNSARGYTGVVREQCLKDTCSYLDVTYFRTFPLEIQESLLKLSCFETLTPELLAYMLRVSREQAMELLQKLLEAGSVIEPCGKDTYRFCLLFGAFLSRIVTKYIDLEDQLDMYRRAMAYFREQEDYLAALRFADLLDDEERTAELLDLYLEHHSSYMDFMLLEEYLLNLPPVYVIHYPRLICAAAMLEALLDNPEAAVRYESYLEEQMDKCQDEVLLKEYQSCWSFLKLCMPGTVEPEKFLKDLEKMQVCWTNAGCAWVENFTYSQISLLHGDIDYCELFAEDGTFFRPELSVMNERMDGIRGEYANGVLEFLMAELYYEYDQLDRSLEELSRSMTKARACGNLSLSHLCGVLLTDILTAKNQAEGAGVFLLRQMDIEDGMECGADSVYYENYLAHKVYYDLLKGDREKVDLWMEEHAPDETGRFYTFYYNRYLMKVRVYILQEKYVMARLILQTLKQFASAYGMHYLEIQARILEAVIFWREGNAEWRGLLEEALVRARRYRFIRVFADEGAAVYELLRETASPERQKDPWFRSVLTAVRAQMLIYPDYLTKEKNGPSLQAFSSYEKDVMRLLAQGEKNAGIAKTLCVSENTVKYHLKNIYQKLNVNSRSQAVKLISEYHLI